MFTWRKPVWHRHPLHLLCPRGETSGNDPTAHSASLPSVAWYNTTRSSDPVSSSLTSSRPTHTWVLIRSVCVCSGAGMLLAGLLLRNVPYITDAIFIDTHWSAALRNIALSIILTRAGLGLDPSVNTNTLKQYTTIPRVSQQGETSFTHSSNLFPDFSFSSSTGCG